MAARPRSWYDMTASPGVRTDEFVLDFLADTGDGFDATYAMARCVSGEFLPGVDAGVAGRADLLVLGGDEVYPVASETTYDVRLKNVFAEADPAEGGYVVAVPGNHDWYGDSLDAFSVNFCNAWVEDGAPGAPAVISPAPNADTILGRYPFQSRSYFAVKLPFNWWLWGIDIQLDARIDDHQVDYFLDFVRPLVKEGDRVILCTARPSWQDTPEPKLDYYCNRTRLAWFLNRMFGSDDPPLGEPPPDWVDHVPLLLSGDKHHYARYTRHAEVAETAPMHMVTCGGGGAFLSSTHHLEDRVSAPWHLSEPGPAYELQRTYPEKRTSRWELSAKFWRIPLVNKVWTPALVVAMVAHVAVALTAALRGGGGTWAWFAVAAAVPLLVATGLAYAFRPRPYPSWRKWVTVPLLGAGHAASYVATAVLAVWVSLALDQGRASFGSWSEAAASLWEGRPVGPLVVGAVVLVLVALAVFALYWLVADLVGWHENEFFAGMCLTGYKSFVRIVLSPPESPDTAGDVTAAVYGVKKVPNNRRRRAGLADPEVALIDSWFIRS